jgi:hypothetical protein
MKKFLVISYDGDQQQWFYDVVIAADEGQAKASILEVRSYCQDADCFSAADFLKVARSLQVKTEEQIERDFQTLIAEHK